MRGSVKLPAEPPLRPTPQRLPHLREFRFLVPLSYGFEGRSDTPVPVTEYGLVVQHDLVRDGEHVDVEPRVPPIQVRLGVHSVLGAQREVDAAHALVSSDVTHPPL